MPSPDVFGKQAEYRSMVMAMAVVAGSAIIQIISTFVVFVAMVEYYG